jgi:hypothetical protein
LSNMEAPGMHGEPQTNGKAIASLVCGIASVTVLWLLAAIPAIVLGHISRSEIRRSAGRLSGGGMALAGLIMGYISIAIVPVILIIAVIAIPSLLRARQVTHEQSAISKLRTIGSAESAYRSATKGGYGRIDDLIDQDFLPSEFDNRQVSGYYFDITVGTSGTDFTATAEPATANEARYAYFVTSDGTVRYSTNPQLAPPGVAGEPVH